MSLAMLFSETLIVKLPREWQQRLLSLQQRMTLATSSVLNGVSRADSGSCITQKKNHLGTGANEITVLIACS